MAKCFIHGHSLIDNYGKQACLKIYRDRDDKELSINFDNSLGAFKDECRRIEACVFSPASDLPEITEYISDSTDLLRVLQSFLGE